MEPLRISLHPHAMLRATERGAVESEVIEAVQSGENFPAKFNRMGFRMNFAFDDIWNNRHYMTKQIEAYCVEENGGMLVITVIVKYF